MSHAEAFMPYSPEERAIFRYFDGGKTVAVDPLVVIKKFGKVDGLAFDADLQIAIADNEAMAKESDEAFERLVAASREVFGLKPFAEVDGVQSGLTDAESFRVLVEFAKMVGGLQRAAGPFLNSPEPTDSAGSEGPSTDYGSDFTLTATESSEEKLQPSV